MRTVDHRIKHALGWDSPNWQMKNACRACSYKLEGELKLIFSCLVVMDGNNSLKRMRTVSDRIAADMRVLDFDYFLLREYVDKYANEVKCKKDKKDKKSSKSKAQRQKPDDISDDEDSSLALAKNSLEGDPTDGPGSVLEGDPLDSGMDPDDIKKALAEKLRESCVMNWKVAASDEKKKMWSVFQECGVFATACHHGFCEQLCDMIRSGELAKYLITMVAKILEVLEEEVNIEYDISCMFKKTLRYHPNVIPGMGLEDLKTLEHMFSASNHLASITRYPQHIGVVYLSKPFDIINKGTIDIEHAKTSLSITDADLDLWKSEQICFFATVGKEVLYDLHEITYVELLEELPAIEERCSRIVVSFITWNPRIQDRAEYDRHAAETKRRDTERRSAIEQHMQVVNEIAALEWELGIHERWTPEHPKYQEVLAFVREKKCRKCLLKVEGLIYQRLFELSRLNFANTSYKARTHLTKALQKRSRVIRQVIAAYNKAAAVLMPPKKLLDWETIVECDFVEEFNFIEHSNDITEKLWCKIQIQEVMKLRHRIARTHEELQHCTTELRHLHTAIRDEPYLFAKVLANLDAADDLMHGAVLEYTQLRQKVNARIMMCIWEVYEKHPHYNWTKTPGIWLSTQAPPTGTNVELRSDQDDTIMQDLPTASAPPPSCEQHSDNDEDSSSSDGKDEDGEDGEEEVEETVGAFVDYISGVF
ncbi:hypothetical protein NM688_g856 [Phlebia brevispora]|uniref:Uncharacterized protein n=1 Tax=Phlebia brevispora TaxID=194682 RepID=A0ACC1TDG4_9APHY|nr:hypothetical protein NM688_g856 [Phlebia brevispora]